MEKLPCAVRMLSSVFSVSRSSRTRTPLATTGGGFAGWPPPKRRTRCVLIFHALPGSIASPRSKRQGSTADAVAPVAETSPSHLVSVWSPTPKRIRTPTAPCARSANVPKRSRRRFIRCRLSFLPFRIIPQWSTRQEYCRLLHSNADLVRRFPVYAQHHRY